MNPESSVTPSSSDVASAEVSLAPHRRGERQPAQVWVRGISYPGEVIVADSWEPAWGDPLEGRRMFRVVLLTRAQAARRLSRAEIRDGRIAVAVPEGDPVASAGALARQASELRETSARYAVSGDPQLSSLGRALRERTTAVDRGLASRLREGWSHGNIIWGIAGSRPPIDRGTAFFSDDPKTWIDAMACALLLRHYEKTLAPVDRIDEQLLSEDLARAWDWCVRSGTRVGAPRSVFALGLAAHEGSRELDVGGCQPLAAIDAALSLGGGTVGGTQLRRILVHDGGIPPDVAAVYVAAHVAARDSEVRLRHPTADEPGAVPAVPRLIRDDLERHRWSPQLLEGITELRSAVTSDWDSALPYLRLILPNARPAVAGGPVTQAAAFVEELEALQSRFVITMAVMDRLERTLGESGRTKNDDSERLFTVLASGSWREFFTRARAEFGNVARLEDSLELIKRSRRAGEDALEIELCVRYLDEAQFARGDTELKVTARSLRSQIDLGELIENAELWPPIVESFERWRADYRHAYLEEHAHRQELDSAVLKRIERTERQVRALVGFARIPELGPPPANQLIERWREVSETVSPCACSPDEIPLAGRPYCEACRMLPGSTPTYSDVEAVMAEVERQLAEYNSRLSSVAVRELLSGQRPEEVEKLLKLNDAADLSALAGVLDGEVIDFLRQFLRGSETRTPAGDDS